MLLLLKSIFDLTNTNYIYTGPFRRDPNILVVCHSPDWLLIHKHALPEAVPSKSLWVSTKLICSEAISLSALLMEALP